MDSVGDKAVYEDTTTMVKVDGQHSKALSVIEISSCSSVIRQENSETASLWNYILNADDLVLVADTEKLLLEKLSKWKYGN